jgi:hypothetical protein
VLCVAGLLLMLVQLTSVNLTLLLRGQSCLQ